MKKEASSEPKIDEIIIGEAVTNYIGCLRLKASSQVLVITDSLPESEADDSQNLGLRRKMAGEIADRLGASGFNVSTLEMNGSLKEQEMYDATFDALFAMNSSAKYNPEETIIVYLGEAWNYRSEMYRAANEFGQNNKVRLAGSLGFTTGDLRVMSQFNKDRKSLIEAQSEYFDAFFIKHPAGNFNITTTTKDDRMFLFTLHYDATMAPFETDKGWFEYEFRANMNNIEYINIPGGEKYGPPYSYKSANGRFVADDIIFTVENGMVVAWEAERSALESVTGKSQKLLLEKVSRGEFVPVAELGLGFYDSAGIDVYTDGSILTMEKQGPHIGMGNDPTGRSPEAGEMKEKSGKFHHTDFVLNNPQIVFFDSASGDETNFYPIPLG